ncbi:hypothetical protein BG015_011444 [Linnemannia schmuckeri]|uniref:Uncharacterized protein n=1 Tax=Linnemannia schmuckeri TaxID=64567 RepID=A0A9P5V8D1_9FUNG|nr:hypothetical protein BG015_011444 [Linnemannia schmuckeri]
MSKSPYDIATTAIFPAYPPAGPGPSSSSNAPPPCPPSYEEAISHQLSVSPPPTTTTTPQPQQQQYHPSSEDFIKVVHNASSTGLEMDQDMDEDDQDYEESRPLKMGRIPDTRAQYTFIQPNDTIQAGKKKKNKNCNSTCATPENNGSPLPPHPGYPQQYPGSAYPYPPRHPQYAAPPHDLTQRPYTAPIPDSNSMQRLYPVPGPALNAPSAPPSAPDTAPPTSYASPSMPPPPLEQFNDNKNIHPPPSAPADFASGSRSGSPGFSSATAPTATYAPPPFPPPPSQGHPAQEAPLAGVPSIPSLMNSQDISIAEFERTKKGVESCDPILGDPYQLYRFFVAHNDRPSLHIVIKGHHIEKHETYETDSDGNRKLVIQDHYVEDFKMDFDLTPYVVPRGALFTAPDPKTGTIPTIKQVLEQFADEENPFKEMHMHKSIQWDYEELTRAITHAIRSVNYRHSINISYPCTNNVVIVRSASPLAKFMRSNWTKFFCFLTCVGVIFYPARAIYKKVKDKTLKSEFQMAMTTRDFYMQYYWSIVDQVQYR